MASGKNANDQDRTSESIPPTPPFTRVLTEEERKALYGDGEGLRYPFVSDGKKSSLLDNLTAFYPMNEESGDPVNVYKG